MNRKFFAAVLAVTTLASATPVFARDWDGWGWSRQQRVEAAHRQVERERAQRRHDAFVRQRYGIHDQRRIARGHAVPHYERW
jgi:hypothetical protein